METLTEAMINGIGDFFHDVIFELDYLPSIKTYDKAKIMAASYPTLIILLYTQGKTAKQTAEYIVDNANRS